MTQTTDQHRVALDQANGKRMSMAVLKQEIAALPRPEGRKYVASLLMAPDDTTNAMRLTHLLRSIERLGITKERKIISCAGLGSSHVRVRDMTPAQRRSVALLLTGASRIPGGTARVRLFALDRLVADGFSAADAAKALRAVFGDQVAAREVHAYIADGVPPACYGDVESWSQVEDAGLVASILRDRA